MSDMATASDEYKIVATRHLCIYYHDEFLRFSAEDAANRRRYGNCPISKDLAFLVVCLSRLSLKFIRPLIPLPQYSTIHEE
jgi:hypothetical protein